MRFLLDRLRLSVADMEDIEDPRGAELRRLTREILRLNCERTDDRPKADRVALRP